MISDETPDEKEKILWETLAFLGVLKSPMKLVTGGIKVRESFGWIFGLAFLRCSFPGSERPQVNGSEVKGPNYNMITYDFLCLTKMHTSFLQILLNKCSFSLFKDILFCVYMHTRARMCGCMHCVGAHQGWKSVPHSSELDLQVAASCTWMLGIQLRFLLERQHLLLATGPSSRPCMPLFAFLLSF